MKEQGFLLLIKGKTGTGKTMLAIEILKECDNSYYFSTRLPPAYLIKNVPQLTDFLSTDHIYDATQIPPFEITPVKRRTPPDFEKIRFQDVAEFFEILVDKVKIQEGKTVPLVVIDSWDAIFQIGEERREKSSFVKEQEFEKLFSEWVHSTNIKVILILEKPIQYTIDLLADGIVTLKDTRLNGLRIRKLELQKLSAGRINQPEYVFSLDGAHFRIFPPYKFKFPEILLRPEPIPDLNINAISTGMQSFDELLQVGYPQGSWILFELSNGVGQGFLQLLIPTLVNQLNLGRGVIATLPEGISINHFEIYLEGFVDGEKIAQYFILLDRPSVKENIRSKTVPLGDTLQNTLEEFHRQEDIFMSYIDGPVLKILGLDKLEYIYSPEELRKNIPNEIAYSKTSTSITLAFIKEDQKLVNDLSHLASRHYKFEIIDKALFLRGIQPQTGYVGITPVISGGYLDTKFIDIV